MDVSMSNSMCMQDNRWGSMWVRGKCGCQYVGQCVDLSMWDSMYMQDNRWGSMWMWESADVSIRGNMWDSMWI